MVVGLGSSTLGYQYDFAMLNLTTRAWRAMPFAGSQPSSSGGEVAVMQGNIMWIVGGSDGLTLQARARDPVCAVRSNLSIALQGIWRMDLSASSFVFEQLSSSVFDASA